MTDQDIFDACRKHGPKAVYDAAHRHMGGDKVRGLASVGLAAVNMGEVVQVASRAYDQLGPAAQAIDYAQATAELSRFEK